MIAVSGWLLWRSERGSVALVAWGIQLALNAHWSPIFFGLQQPGWAFLEIRLLWIAIVATVVLAWPVSRTAAALLLPYGLWVTFAAALNFAVWRLNAGT